MAKKSAKSKASPVDQQALHPDFGLDTSKMPPEPPQIGVEDEGAETPIITAEELAALRQQITDLTANQTALIRAGQAQPQQRQPQPGPQLPKLELNLDGLPDPATDAPGFLKGFSQRAGALISQAQINAAAMATAQAGAAIARNSAADAAWDLMKDKHPDLVEHREVVEAATKSYVASLAAKNIDPQGYLETNVSQFVEDVATQAQGIIDRIRGTTEDEGEDADLPDASRTQGIPGGGAQGTSRGGKKAPAKPGLFTDEIKAAQRELGLF